MSFLSKALRRAEVFLEQVDESVAQASRRAVVEGATGDVDDGSWMPTSDDPLAAGVLEPGDGGAAGDDVDVTRPPVQRRRGVANIRRGAERAQALGDGTPPVPAAPAEGAREESGSVAGTLGSASSVRSGPPRTPSAHVPQPLVVAGEEAGDGGAAGDAGARDKFDVPGTTPDGAGAQGPGDAGLLGDKVPANVGASEAAGEPGADALAAQAASQSESGADGGAATAVNPTQPAGSAAAPVGEGRELPKPAGVGRPLTAPASGVTRGTITAESAAPAPRPAPPPPATGSKGRTSGSPLAAATGPPAGRVHGVAPAAPADATDAKGDQPARGAMEPAGAQAGQAGGGGAGGEDEMAATIEENEDLRKELELAEEDFNDLLRERAKLMHSLKSLKEVAAEQEEALEEKSAEVRRLGEAMAGLQDQKSKLQQQLKESNAAGKDAVDLLRRDLTAQLSKVRAELAATRSEEQRLRAENVTVKQALTQGREVDMLTADGARDQASRAQAAHEQEVAAHRETREALKTRQEALDAEAAIAAEAIAAAQRRADEALAAAAAAKEAQRSAESRLARVTSARDAAMARVEDLSRELAPYQASEGGQPPGREELQSLRQTVSELENALEAKNVELTRLEGDVENMRSIVSSRNSSSAARSPGAAGAAGGEYAGGREVEQKLRHMADSALRKQAQLEVLRSENKALQHQLDTERKRTREAQAMAAVATSSRHNLRGGFRGIMDGGDEERGDRGYGVREGPMARFRAPRAWPAGVVHFLGSLDKLTAQALGFLRKEPLIRMALLIYVVAVHVLLYGMLHYHVEATMTVPGAGVHAHPREGLVPHVKH